ncbi:MAG: hypothetical protein H0U95_13930 [Bacteroidetes bacterium]|nr:hypothetical protein [Bacteroidota bacterium]
MNKLNLLFIFLSLLCGCKKSGLKEPFPEKTNNNLKYFGFTLIDVGWDEPGDKSSKINYTDEVSNFCNIADILVTEPSANIMDRVEYMNSLGVKPILHLNDMFFEKKSSGGGRSGVILGLRNDYQQRWDEFIAANNLTGNFSKIHSFYIGEEPAWNSIPEAEFKMACDYAKATVPQVPIMLIEAYLAIDYLYAPASVDYVGFDHYFLPSSTKSSIYLSEHETLKSRILSHQKIFLVADTHWIKILHGSAGISKNDMDFIAREYYKFANTDTSIVGILGYFWPSGFDKKGSTGARGLPNHVKKEYEKIGKAITGK